VIAAALAAASSAASRATRSCRARSQDLGNRGLTVEVHRILPVIAREVPLSARSQDLGNRGLTPLFSDLYIKRARGGKLGGFGVQVRRWNPCRFCYLILDCYPKKARAMS